MLKQPENGSPCSRKCCYSPVLVLASDRDYTPTSAKRAYMALLRDARLVEIRDSGHASPADQPAAVLAAIESFVAELERPGAAPRTG